MAGPGGRPEPGLVGPGFHGESIIEVDLRLEGSRLVGIADTYAKGYFEVAHWVDLARFA
jgi:hypothetical protein